MTRFNWFNATTLTLGFAFLYLPIILLMIYSFNESRLVTVWAGFSTKWYQSVFSNESFMNAAWVTLRVGFISASLATVLGTMAALVLNRAGSFKGKTLFTGMIYATMVMPEVITGLSLLLLFVSLDFTRGFWTVTLAHITFSMCYATVVISARLVTFERSMEEAALDLGCTRFSAFMQITLPIIFPAILAAWLLAFTLSLDDLVIASFASGPGATTLPMKIYSQVRIGVSPEINALSSILIAVVAFGVVTASLITKQAHAKRMKEEQQAHSST